MRMGKRTEVNCRICKSFLHTTEQHGKKKVVFHNRYGEELVFWVRKKGVAKK